MNDKKALRAMLLEQRSLLTTDSHTLWSQALCFRIQRWLVSRSVRQLVLYRSFRREPSVHWLEAMWPAEQLYFPVVSAEQGQMDFFRLHPDRSLQLNKFGIEEPNASIEGRLIPDADTVMLVPALAFDRQGFRLGYGMGYYDRYLEDFPGTTVGVCFESFVQHELPREAHDQAVHYVVTEQTFYAGLSHEKKV